MNAPLALAFTAGMVASINPCGFALLPAYVAAFVAGDDATVTHDRRILRAVTVSIAVSIGFALTFVFVGVIFDAASGALRRQMPWLTIAIGAAMLLMGVAALAGWTPRLPFQKATASSARSTLGMVGFGCTYAVVSLSCTLGPFLSVTGFAMKRSTLGGIITYTTYAVGMGVIILVLSVSAAIARDSFVGSLRSMSRYAPRFAALLLIISGTYAIWYGRHELRVYAGDLRNDRFVEFGTNLQTRFIVITESIGATRIGVFVVALTALAYLTLRRRSSRREATTAPTPDLDDEHTHEQEQHA